MRHQLGFIEIKDKEDNILIKYLQGKDCCQCVKDFYDKGNKIIIYIPTCYLEEQAVGGFGGGSYVVPGYGEEGLLKWIEFISEMGFTIRYIGIGENRGHYAEAAGLENKYYIMELWYKDHINNFHTLAAYQALRTIYFYSYDEVIQECYRLKEEMPELENFICLQLAYRVARNYNPTWGLTYTGGKYQNTVYPYILSLSNYNTINFQELNKKNLEIVFHYKPCPKFLFEKNITASNVSTAINEAMIRIKDKKEVARTDPKNLVAITKLEELIKSKDSKRIMELTTDNSELEYFKG